MTPILPSGNAAENIPVNFENFDLLFEKYGAVVYGIVFRAVKEEEKVAEKLTAEVFVYVYHHIQSYNSNTQRFLTWVISVVMKLLITNGYHSQIISVTGLKPGENDSRGSLNSILV